MSAHEKGCPCYNCSYLCDDCKCTAGWMIDHEGHPTQVYPARVTVDLKPSNPKDIVGSTKLPLDLVPASVTALASLAFLEGALKYGTCNWRICGVSARIYVAAAKRHLDKWFEGEECDPKTKVPHLANALACIGIIHDAKLAGKLNDDRPPSTPVSGWIDEAAEIVKHLKELFKNESPKHYAIEDTQPQEKQ